MFRYSLHHMLPGAQESLLRAAVRVLRPGGQVVIVEDSYDEDAAALADNVVTSAFGRLSAEDKLAALALLDASSCLTTPEQMPFAFSFRSAADWRRLLSDVGFPAPATEYWGFSMFSLYAAPMLIIRAAASRSGT